MAAAPALAPPCPSPVAGPAAAASGRRGVVARARRRAGLTGLALTALAVLAAACAQEPQAGGRVTAVSEGGLTTGDAPNHAGASTAGTAGGGATTGGSIGTGTPVSGGGGSAFSASPGLSIMVADGSACLAIAKLGGSVALSACDGTTSQRWELLGGAVRALSGNFCLAAAAQDGGNVSVATCNGASTQQFTVAQGHLMASSSVAVAASAGAVCLGNPDHEAAVNMVLCSSSAATPLVLGIDGVQLSPGVNSQQCLVGSALGVDLTTCTNSDTGQMWTFYGKGELMLASLQLCLDLAGSPGEGTAATLAGCSGSATQQWSWNGQDSTLRPYFTPSKALAPSGFAGALVITGASLQSWKANK